MTKKIALVVGGSGGIGMEIVRSLAADAFHVCFTYRHKTDKTEALQESCKASVAGYCMDLADETTVKAALDRIQEDSGDIDVLVFSVTPPVLNKNILKAAWEDYAEHWNLQVKGLFFIVQNLKERILKKKPLKFILIGTEYCFGKPPAGLSHYVQAKYALLGLAKSMAVDLANYHCTVNLVSPGMVETSLLSTLPPKLIEITAATNPLKRIATPKDVANTVLFLASDGADYLNGVDITVNGGNIML